MYFDREEILPKEDCMKKLTVDRRPPPRRHLRRRPDGHGPLRTFRRGAGQGQEREQAHPSRFLLEWLRGLQTAGSAVLQQPQVRRFPQQERHPLPGHPRRQDRRLDLREVQDQCDADRAVRRQERPRGRLDRRLRASGRQVPGEGQELAGRRRHLRRAERALRQRARRTSRSSSSWPKSAATAIRRS